MVIGRGKEQLIQQEPLLAWHFKIFKEVLFQTNRHLLLIGYGFGDDHINDIIANAMKQYGLKIYIISPSSVNSFRNGLSNKKFGDEIWRSLAGYYPYDLLQIFPTGQTETPFYQNLHTQFFDH